MQQEELLQNDRGRMEDRKNMKTCESNIKITQTSCKALERFTRLSLPVKRIESIGRDTVSADPLQGR